LIKHYHLLILLLFGVFIFVQCAKEPPAEIAAAWGDIRITLSDFERSYFNYWQMLPDRDSPELRRQFARQLVEQEIIVRRALKNGEVDEGKIESLLSRDLSYFLRRRYLEKTIKDTIAPVSDEELATALQRRNISMRVRQLYAQSEAEINQLHQRLQAGERFEDLARSTMPDPYFAQREGDLGWIGWGDTDLPVEEVLYGLETGRVSQPVQSLMGWHILRVDSVKYTWSFHQDDNVFLRREMRHRIMDRKLDMAAAYHLRDLIWSKSLAVDTRLFQDIWNYLAPLLPKNAKEGALRGYSDLEVNLTKELGRQSVAYVDGQPFTVAEFITAVPTLPRNLLRPNLKKAIEIAVRDKIIVQEALQKGLDKDPVVREKMNRSRTAYLYYAILANADSIHGQRVNLQDYYRDNQHRYIYAIESEIEEILVDRHDLALELARKIHSGENFAELTRAYSLRKETREKGGYLGYLSSKDHPIGQKAAQLKSSDVFAPVVTQEGYHVIRVGQQKIFYTPYEELKDRLAADARREYYTLLHKHLLSDTYNPNDVQLNDHILNRALRETSTTLF